MDNLFLRFTPETVEKIICYADTQTEKWTKYLNIATRNLNYGKNCKNGYMMHETYVIHEILSSSKLQTHWLLFINYFIDEEKRNAAIGLLPCNFPIGRKNKKRCTTDEALCAFIDCQPVSIKNLFITYSQYLIIQTVSKKNGRPSIVNWRGPYSYFLSCQVDFYWLGKCLEKKWSGIWIWLSPPY